MTENVNFHIFEYICERDRSIMKKSKPIIFVQASKDQIFGKIINCVSRTSESTHKMLVNYSTKTNFLCRKEVSTRNCIKNH